VDRLGAATEPRVPVVGAGVEGRHRPELKPDGGCKAFVVERCPVAAELSVPAHQDERIAARRSQPDPALVRENVVDVREQRVREVGEELPGAVEHEQPLRIRDHEALALHRNAPPPALAAARIGVDLAVDALRHGRRERDLSALEVEDPDESTRLARKRESDVRGDDDAAHGLAHAGMGVNPVPGET